MRRHRPRRTAIQHSLRMMSRLLARLPFRPLGAMMLLALLAACAETPHQALPVAQEAADYRAHARTYYPTYAEDLKAALEVLAEALKKAKGE